MNTTSTPPPVATIMKPVLKSKSSSCDTQRFSSSSSSSLSSTHHEVSWRKDGILKRNKLLKEDESNGGCDFTIDRRSKLKNYFEIADRVLDQFQKSYASQSTLEESYLMGNRLIKFLSIVLPTHENYYSKDPSIVKLRIKSQNDLSHVRSQMEDIALMLDHKIYQEVMDQQGLEGGLSQHIALSSSPKVGKGRKGNKKKVSFAMESQVLEVEQVQPQHLKSSHPNCQKRTIPELCNDNFHDSFTISTKTDQHGIIDFFSSDLGDDDGWKPISPTTGFGLEWPDDLCGNDFIPSQPPLDNDQAFSQNVFDDITMDMVSSNSITPITISKRPLKDSNLFSSTSNNHDSNPIFAQDDIASLQDFEPETTITTTELPDPSLSCDFSDSSESDNLSAYSDFLDDSEFLEDDKEELTFVERIARENTYCDINTFSQENDDSDADEDSWAQGEEEEDEVDEDSVHEDHDDHPTQLLEDHEISVVDAYNRDLDQNLPDDCIDSQPPEYPYNSPEKFSFYNQSYLSDERSSHATDEQPSTSFMDESDDEMEHQEFLRQMREVEFQDDLSPCDSSGGDKTSSTAETEALTFDTFDSSDDDDQDDDVSQPQEDPSVPTLGIVRRDEKECQVTIKHSASEKGYEDYITRLRNERRKIATRSDVLESKIKNLQIERCGLESTCTPSSPSSKENVDQHNITTTDAEVQIISKTCDNETDLTESTSSPTKSSPGRYSKVERLKNLKKTSAWQRRYGATGLKR
jgi:hypothetical protein